MSQFRLIDYDEVLASIEKNIDGETDRKRVMRASFPRRIDTFIETANSERLKGDDVCANLYSALDRCGLQRTSTQRMFHKKFIESSLPHVYGKRDFGRFRERILNDNGVPCDTYNQYTLISTPRRWGKTTSVAMFVACMLFCVPHAWISVFSTGRRASKSLADLVHKFLTRLEEGTKKSRVIVKNTEELFYAGDTASDVRQLFSYPATVQVRIISYHRSSCHSSRRSSCLCLPSI